MSFLQHRFNVVFVYRAAIYHCEHIAQFLEQLPESNKLLLCIKDSIQSPICLAALRDLEIITVLIIQPLWKVVEQNDVKQRDNLHQDVRNAITNISKMSTKSHRMQNHPN